MQAGNLKLQLGETETTVRNNVDSLNFLMVPHKTAVPSSTYHEIQKLKKLLNHILSFFFQNIPSINVHLLLELMQLLLVGGGGVKRGRF